MAKYSNTVEYQIRTTLDSSGISKLKAELSSLQNSLMFKNAQGLIPKSVFNETMASIRQVDVALTKAFNGKVGMLNLGKFRSELLAGGRTLNDYYKTFSSLGSQGTRAFGQIYGQLNKIDTGMRQVSSTTDKIMNTFGNTFRWGMIASIFSGMMNSVHQAAQYVKDLDKSLTNIQMVTASSRDNMNNFAVQANEAAKKLGGTTVQMTNATEVFIRQGYDLATSTELGQYAVHLANVSGQDSATASDEITAYMNAFKIPLEDLGTAVSKWAAVANNAAVSVEELSVASQKAAAVATTVGVDMDQFAAHIAAIEATTREAPENIGNGLKTIYSRIADVKLGETLEDGVDLGSFAKAIEKVGVDVLDSAGNLRDAGDILQDLMVVWQDLDQTQRAAVAKTVAGRFQLARFEALMNSADIYEKSLKTSQAETDTTTYDRMQETYRDSMEGRLNALSATVEGIFTKAFSTDDFYGIIDAATKLAETFDNLVQSIGGGKQAVLAFAAIITKAFSAKMAQGIGNFVQNRETNKLAASNINSAVLMARQDLQGQGLSDASQRMQTMDKNVNSLKQHFGVMSQEQLDGATSKLQQYINATTEAEIAEQRFVKTLEIADQAFLSVGLEASAGESKLQKYQNTLKRLFQLQADGAPITAELLKEDEMFTALQKDAESLIRQLVGISDVFEKNAKSGIEFDASVKQLQGTMQSTIAFAKQLAAAENADAESVARFNAVVEILTGIESGLIKEQDQLNNAIIHNVGSYERFQEALQLVLGQSKEYTTVLMQQRDAMMQTHTAAETLGAEVVGKAAVANVQSLANGFTNMASAAMTGMFAIQSFTNLFNIWDNEDLDIGEKLEQSMLNITMLAAMGIPAITQMKKAITEVSLGITTWTEKIWGQYAAEQAISGALMQEVGVHGQLTTSIMEEIAAETGSNVEEVKAIAIKEGYIAATEGEIIAIKAKDAAQKASTSSLILATIAEKLATSAYGKSIKTIIKAIASRWGLVGADTAVKVAEGEMGAAALAAAGPISTLLLFAAPLIALAAILGTVALVSKSASEEAEKRKERLEQEIEANKAAVDSIHEHRESLAQLHNEYQRTGEASDEYKDTLKEQAEALGITNAELLISSGRYDELKNKIDEATLATLSYNDALLKQQSEDAKQEVGNAAQGLSSDAAQAAGLTSSTQSVWGGASISYYDEDAIAKLNKVNTAYEENKEQVAELTKQLNSLKATNESGIHTAEITALEKEKEKLLDIQDEYAKLLGLESSQQILENQKSLIDNSILEAEVNGDFIGQSYESIYSTLTKSGLFPEIEAYLQGMGEEEAHAFVNSLIYGIGEDLNNASLMDAARFDDVYNSTIQSLVDSQGISDNAAQYWLDNLIHSDEFKKLDQKTQIKILAGLDVEQSFEQIQADVQEVLGRLKEGDTVEGVSSAEDIVTMKPHDEDVSEEAFQNLGRYIGANAEDLDGFAVSLKHDTDELANVTEAILRYDSALAKSEESMEDWEKALNSNKLEDKAEAAAELANVYEDMLDVGEDLSLSDKFVEDTENLELLKEAAEGTEEAYEELQDKAAEDILTHFKLDDSQIQAAMDDINSMQDQISDIEIGAKIDESFYPQLENIINEAGMTAEEASAFLSTIGVDIDPSGFEEGVAQVPDVAAAAADAAAAAMNIITEVESGTAEEDTTDTYSDVVANVDYVDAPSTFPAGTPDGAPINFQGSVAQVKYDVHTHSIPKKQSAAGFGMKAKSAGGKGGTGGLKIKPGAAKKGASGGAKYNNATHGRGSGGGGKGGGGGGGGGKGKSYEPKKKDFEKKEKDRYEKVNTAIDKIDSSIQNLTMDQDRLIGTRWADNLEKETKLLKEQIPWYQEKLKIQKAEAAELKKQLGTDFGAKFGKNGQLLNYSNIFDNLEKARKAAYDKYNAATTEAGQEAAQKEIDAIEKRFENFNKIYARYDTLWSKEMPETEKALKEIQDRLEDIAEEARKARREAAKSLDEIRETEKEIEKTFANLSGEHPEFNFTIDMARIDDLINGAAFQDELANWIDDYEQKLAKTTDKNMKQWYKDQIALLKDAQANGTSVLDLNQQRLAEISKAYEQWMDTGESDLFGENEQAMLDAMNQTLDDGKDLMSKLDSAIKDAKQDIEDIIEMLDNNIEKRQDELDAIGDKIEYIRDISEIIYGDQATAQQVNLYNLQAQNEENRLKELEKERELQHQIVEQREKILAADPNNKTAQEEYLDALKKEQEIDKDILDTRKEIAEAYKDAKEAANDLAVDNWLNNFQGVIDGVNVPLEYMADQWERIQENEDLYLDDLNKAYEIQKLQNKYQEMLNDATDPAIQQQITDQMNEQLQYLREKTNLSKYDVEYANAQLEILQKTIALEDARAAKNQMKLRRDSQGNYQYVYAADKNETMSAENDLLDATMNAYNMSKEQQADVQDSYIKKIQDMGDALRKAANDQKLTKEQIAAITQSIIDDGYAYLDAMGEQLDTSQKNMIQSFIDAAFQMQIENASAVQDIAQDLQDGIINTLDMVDDRFDTSVKLWIGDEGLGGFRDEAAETRDAIISDVQDFEAAVGEANAAIAQPLNEMDSGVQQINTSIEDMTDSMAEFLNLLEQKSGAITQTSDYIAGLQRQLTDSQNDLSTYTKAVNELAEKLKTQETINTQLRTELTQAKSGNTSSSGKKSGGTGDKGVGGTPYELGELAEGIAGNIWTYGSWGNDPVRLNRMVEKFGKETGQRVHDAVQKLFNGQPAYGYDFNPTKWGTSGWSYYKKFDYSKFDTGGYTGAWGAGGRFAMLHEKELVLNAEDTRNILAAVDAVRIVTEQLKGSAFVNNIANTIGRASQNNIQGSNVEQRVEITANFPNANSAKEIEEALLSLSDTSYQYAYNKNDTPW